MTVQPVKHEHMFPLNPKAGPCACGLTREQALGAGHGETVPRALDGKP